MDKVPSDDAEAAAGRCCDGADHDVGTGANGSSSPSAASRAAAHASTANMVCQPLLGPQETQATPGHRSPLGWVTSYVTVFTVGMGGDLLGESGSRYMVAVGEATHQPP